MVLFIHRSDFSSAFYVQIAQLLRNHDSKLVGRPREFPEIIKRKNCWSLQLLPHKLCKGKISPRQRTFHIKHAMSSKLLKCVFKRQNRSLLMDEFDDLGWKLKVTISGNFTNFSVQWLTCLVTWFSLFPPFQVQICVSPRVTRFGGGLRLTNTKSCRGN